MTSAFNLLAKFALVPRPSTPFDLTSERKLRSGHLFSSFSMSGCGSGSVGSGSGKRGNLNINCSIGGPVQLDQVPASALASVGGAGSISPIAPFANFTASASRKTST